MLLPTTSRYMRCHTDRLIAGVVRRRSTITIMACRQYLNHSLIANVLTSRSTRKSSIIRPVGKLSTASATTTFPDYTFPSVILAPSVPRPQLTVTPIQATQATQSTAAISTSKVTGAITASSPLLNQLPTPIPSVTALPSVAAAATVANTNTINTNKIHFSDLRALFIASSIPMIGFGFMDQFVLIQAGGYIDATFGMKLGLATLSAAAAGQVVSDVSGVVFGGALERFLTSHTSWLRTPRITTQQRQLPICRNVALLGAIVGVILGCALGATSLLLVDLEARQRMERAQRLRDIVQDMIASISAATAAIPDSTTNTTTRPDSASDPVFPCDSCTIYVVSTKDLTIPTDHNSKRWKVDLKDISSAMHSPQANHNDNYDMDEDSGERALVQQCITSRSIVLSEDRRILYAPLRKRSANNNSHSTTTTPTKDIMAIVAFRYGSSHENSSSSSITTTTSCYSDEDVITARVMARHIAIFMDR